ncbi:BlaI/MecI/CopY family transcriptional regulator [Natranaerofaba carboxydovora]|uniref:BlaI/MecI/CopY family transcriptional regulator n=1 Tax=Natranaerofaba carboxydovora TaxID=2742683 RepID=UPI001F12E455|nr:BlaI/MecI/CopY family transcriptional regulator [Natranaerofaba carboxydovora]UMZ74579.1 Transcriptional regulator BlaI [Natranaerofaba carboxydovora]
MEKGISVGDFRPHEKGLRKILGDLEAEILEKVWEKEPVTVRTIYEDISVNKKIAYTTVMTVMTRLAKKGLLKQQKEGNAYIYTSIWKKDELLSYVVGKVMDGLFEDFEDVAVSKFIEKYKDEDEHKLKKLEEKLLDREKQD